MKLKEIVGQDAINIIGNENVEVLGITNKTDEVCAGYVFVAITGQNVDSHTLVPDTIARGAVAVVVERPLVGVRAVQVVVKNSRIALSKFASAFFGHPERKMKMIGVTGTNGKTTTTHMIYHILNSSGIKCGVVGTSGCKWEGEELNFGMTTPDPVDLEKTLYLMQKDGVKAVAMEVSAHALDLEKTASIVFDVAIFTNLTRDHFDYFGTMEKYKEAKQKLFWPSKCHHAIVCTDDECGKELFDQIICSKTSYGITQAQNEIESIKLTKSGQEFVVKNNSLEQKFFIPLFGDYNTKNTLAAYLAAKHLGIPSQKALSCLRHLPKIEGRYETFFKNNGGMVIIDYAHTPDGLQNLLESAKQIADSEGGRLISLFGCGGNRDTGKRAQMGEISEKFATFSIVTSDNPRLEDPNSIISDVVEHMNKFSYVRVANRADAVNLGVKMLFSNDVLVVAGKGNESYIDINGQKLNYSDKETVKKCIDLL